MLGIPVGALEQSRKLGAVANWFSRRPRRTEAPRIRSRSDDQVTTRIDLVEFTPPLSEYLGRAAYVQLTLFENLSRAVASAPTTAAKAEIGKVAGVSIAKYRALADEITRTGGVPAAVMEPFRSSIDDFQRAAYTADWYETVVACFLTSGFLDDFFVRLAAGFPADEARRLTAIYSNGSGERVLAGQLKAAISANPKLASRLAMWGRRLVGDTMLVARAALHYSDDHITTSDEARIEPVFTELIAAHTRRMDSLGLTA